MSNDAYRLVSFYQDWGRMGALEGLFVLNAGEWRELQLLIEHQVAIPFGECLGKHSDCTGPVMVDEIKVRSENQEFCMEFRRLDLDTGYNPVKVFDADEYWSQTFDEATKSGKDWPPNPDGTFTWSRQK